jgi:prevent-host-death family protein
MADAAHSPTWQLQEAKNRLSEVIHAAQKKCPQTITRHGDPVAMVVPFAIGTPGSNASAWDLLRDDLVASLGGPPSVPRRAADAPDAVTLPW